MLQILLMRYQQGGKGLNLTEANHVIFADVIDDVSLEKQVRVTLKVLVPRRWLNVLY